MFLIFCSSVKKALVRKHPLEDFKQRRYFENNLTTSTLTDLRVCSKDQSDETKQENCFRIAKM
jgi:hypothetical protein